MAQDLTIEDLSKQSGLPLRTLRYYIQKGLLPGPDTAGKYASYSQEHLDYLAMIQRLKSLHLPLKEIQHLLSNMTTEDMRRILGYQDEIQFSMQEPVEKSIPKIGRISDRSSALEYIRDLEYRQTRLQSFSESSSVPAAPGGKQDPLSKKVIQEARSPFNREKESWSRIILAEGVEININEEAGNRCRQQITELMRSADEIFNKGRVGETKRE